MKRIFLVLVLSCFLVPSTFAAFNDQGGGIVWDDVTGLMWQHGHGSSNAAGVGALIKWGGGTVATNACDGTPDPDGESGNEEDALCYCESLTLGTYTDWRLPDRNEMHSTFDYANTPALATPFLDNAADPFYFWTSTSQSGNPSNAWAAGPINQGKLSGSNPKSATNHVRCVRGRVFQVAVSAGANLTVSDASTGTNWVDYGADQDVTFTASPGSTITNVIVDTISLGPQSSPYTHPFSGVVGNHTITAASTPVHAVEVTVGENGTVTDVNNSATINPPGGIVYVEQGATATFEVTAASNHHIEVVQFHGTDVTLDANNQYTTPGITVADLIFTATFAEDGMNSLVVTTGGTGTGTVTSNDDLIDCPGTCSHEYYEDHASDIVLTATPASGSTFTEWTGDCSSATADTCTIQDMSQARSVTATFSSSQATGMNLLQMIQAAVFSSRQK